MTTMFWILWFFIAFLVLLVAFTLRKENEEMPRRDILRAVESTGKMGVAERSFLWVFSWLDTRFRLQDYWNMSKGAYYNMHRQMPLTHAEKYKLRIIWYWYPLYCLGGISFLSFIILVITGTVLGIYYVPGGEGDPPRGTPGRVLPRAQRLAREAVEAPRVGGLPELGTAAAGMGRVGRYMRAQETVDSCVSSENARLVL